VEITAITPKPIATNNNICDAAPTMSGDLGTLGASSGNSVGGGSSINRNNFCADVEAGEPDPEAFDLDRTVWFSFVTPNMGGNNLNVDIDVDNDPNGLGDEIDLQVAIYQSSDGTCSGTFTEIESDYDIVFYDEDLFDLCLAENTRYWVQIDGANNGLFPWTDEFQGYFSLEIFNRGSATGPANDNMCNATAVTLGTTYTTEDNLCATIEPGEPGAGTYAQRTVWYSFVAPTSADVTISLDGNNCFWPIGGGIDPEIHLFSSSNGTCSGTMTEMDNSYIPLNCTIFDEEIVPLCLKPGETYFLQVDGSTAGIDGDFTISVVDNYPSYGTEAGAPTATDPEPENNTCATAVDLTSTIGTRSCEQGGRPFDTYSYGDPTWDTEPLVPCGGENCGDTWYSFVMPQSGFVKIEGEDDSFLGLFTTQLNVVAYTGTCGSLTQVDCGEGGSGSDVGYSVYAAPGTTVYLQVFDADGDDINDDYGLCVTEQCSPDECPDAVSAPEMVYDSLYCINIETMTSEPSSEGYLSGNSAPTEYSTYFEFTTDGFCWGYILEIDIADIDTTDGNGAGNTFCPVQIENQFTVTLFEDATPCDGNPDNFFTLFDKNDCQIGDVINETITLLVGEQIPSNIPNQLYDELDSNKTYILQLNTTNPDVLQGTIKISKICDGREWNYVSDIGTTASDGYCTDRLGWRHYYDDNGTPVNSDDDILIFSIHPQGNTFEGNASISLAPAPYSVQATPAEEGSWVTKRLWDFDMTSGAINSDVKIRFYYEQEDKDEIIAAAQNFALANGLTYEPFEWFKSKNGTDFNPAIHITSAMVMAEYGSWSGPYTTGSTNVLGTLAPQTFPFTEDADAIDGGTSTPGNTYDVPNEWCNRTQYVEIGGLTGFSGGGGATGASRYQSPLPVELVTFVGWNEDDVNQLEWVTASEINNELFVVERSADGIDFVEIGSVPGNGTTTEEHTYDLTDYTPIIGVNYYRLKQIDFDGTFEYSATIAIEVFGGELHNAIVKLHPNPTRDILNLQLQSAKQRAD